MSFTDSGIGRGHLELNITQLRRPVPESDLGAVQEEWGIKQSRRWHEYGAPMHQLAVMIGRTFTSLDGMFDIIRDSQQLGPLDHTSFEAFTRNSQPDEKWRANINLNRPDDRYDTGTFAFWLPCQVSATVIDGGFGSAARCLSDSFYARLIGTKLQYSKFFDISEENFDSNVLRGETEI
ncbi:hypothetical protein ACEPPN_017247 [Leptodophora sp. 'Broadleaf-Isolate-01']